MIIQSIELNNFRNYENLQISFDEGTNIFYGDNDGLVVAEVELSSEDEHINLPIWVKDEVSHDDRYFNSNLMNLPFKDWEENKGK